MSASESRTSPARVGPYTGSTVAPVMAFSVPKRSFSEMRELVATLMTLPLTSVVACEARSAPSTTLVTKVKSRVCSPSPWMVGLRPSTRYRMNSEMTPE